MTLFKGLYLKDDKNYLKISSIIKRHIFLGYITLVVAKTRRKITNYFLSDVKKYSLEVFRYFSSTTLRSASPSMYPRLSKGVPSLTQKTTWTFSKRCMYFQFTSCHWSQSAYNYLQISQFRHGMELQLAPATSLTNDDSHQCVFDKLETIF